LIRSTNKFWSIHSAIMLEDSRSFSKSAGEDVISYYFEGLKASLKEIFGAI